MATKTKKRKTRSRAAVVEAPARPIQVDDSRIEIFYGSVKADAGWMPQVWKNGRALFGTYGRAYDRDVAEALAKREAEDEAGRYAGDWKITIEHR